MTQVARSHNKTQVLQIGSLYSTGANCYYIDFPGVWAGRGLAWILLWSHKVTTTTSMNLD